MNSAVILERVGYITTPVTMANIGQRVISDFHELRMVADTLRSMKRKIVMTAGVYDMLHVGHNRYLAEAKALGDILVVSIDSDALTKRRKGPRRPIVPQDERIEMLLHSRWVDVVTIRDVVHGPDDDIFAVRPDTLITSETTLDFTEEKKQALRREHGINVVTLKAQAATSTSAKVRDLIISGVGELKLKLEEAINQFTETYR